MCFIHLDTFCISIITDGVDCIVHAVLLLCNVLLVVSPQGVTHWKLKDGDVVPASDPSVMSQTNGVFAPKLDPLFDVLMSNLHSQPVVADTSKQATGDNEPEGSSCHQRADACGTRNTILPSDNHAIEQKKGWVITSIALMQVCYVYCHCSV